MSRALALAFLILVLAAAVRFVQPGTDTPHEVELTAAPYQDAFWYLDQAACAHDGSEHESLGSWDRPMWTAIGRTWFALFGSSVESTCALGATFSLASVALAMALAARSLGRSAALCAGLAFALGYPFVVLGRTALIYGPIATLDLAAALLWLEGLDDARERPARAFAFLVLALAIVGATARWLSAGALVVAPALLAAWLARSRWSALQLLEVGAALAVVALAVAWLDPGGLVSANEGRFGRYLATPDEGLAYSLLRRFLLLGGRQAQVPSPLGDPVGRWIGSGFGATTPALCALAAIGVGLAWLDRERVAPRARAALALAATWAVAFAIGATPLDYRPGRFFMLVAPAIALLAAWTVARIAGRARLERGPSAPEMLDVVVLLGVAWVTVAHALALARDAELLPGLAASLDGAKRANGDRAIVALSALVAAAFVFARILGLVRLPTLAPRARLAVACVAALAFAAPDSVRVARAVSGPRSLADAAALARAFMGPRAVVSGTYSSALATGSPLQRRRGAFLASGTPEKARATIAAVASAGFTHMAIDSEQETRFLVRKSWAEVGSEPVLVAAFELGPFHVLLYRFADAEARGHELTPLEKARALEDAGKLDEARALYGPPDAKLAAARARALWYRSKFEAARAALRDAPQDDADVRRLEELMRKDPE